MSLRKVADVQQHLAQLPAFVALALQHGLQLVLGRLGQQQRLGRMG